MHSVPPEEVLNWANVSFSAHAIAQPWRPHNQWSVSRVTRAMRHMNTISNLKYYKCARIRFHCTNGLVVMRICAVAQLRGSTVGVQTIRKMWCLLENEQFESDYSPKCCVLRNLNFFCLNCCSPQLYRLQKHTKQFNDSDCWMRIAFELIRQYLCCNFWSNHP